jgi:hypothetical protein
MIAKFSEVSLAVDEFLQNIEIIFEGGCHSSMGVIVIKA